jgi:polyisoprenoid-binding protein YceI
MIRRFAVSAAILFAMVSAASAQTWTIDTAHSGAHFAVRHMMVSTVRGDLGKITGTVTFDPKQPASAVVEASIDVNGIDTREPKRDAHLKGADFFDAATYPTMTFKSTKIEPAAGGGYTMTGDLTIRGVTKPVVLTVEPLRPAIKDQGGNQRSGTTATGKINRQDFGVKWNGTLDAGGVVVSDEVAITLDVELVQKAAK